MKYKLIRCRSTTSPIAHSSSLPFSGWLTPSNLKKLSGQIGRNKRSLRRTESAMRSAWVTSTPFIPARMLIELVVKVGSRMR